MKRMIKRSGCFVVLTTLVVVGFSFANGRLSFGQGADVRVGELVDPIEAEQRIYESLSRSVDLRFEETPLQDVANELSEALGYPVLLDAVALEDVGLDPAVPITMNVSGITLNAGLKLMLRDLEMDWMIHNEALLLSTEEGCGGQLRVRLYNVSDLATKPLGNQYYAPKIAGDAHELIQVIRWTIHPDSWDEVGGPGTIQPLVVGKTTLLVVEQTGTTHMLIDSLLRRLRDTLAEAESEQQAEGVEAAEDATGQDAAATDENSVTTKVYRVYESANVTADEYVELIRLVIDKAEWDVRDDVFVESAASSVVVKHEVAVQHAVSHLLSDAGAFDLRLRGDVGGAPPSKVDPNAAGSAMSGNGGLFGLRPSMVHLHQK